MLNMKKHLAFDQEIATHIRASEESGELRATENWGKPFNFDDGYERTPAELRMG